MPSYFIQSYNTVFSLLPINIIESVYINQISATIKGSVFTDRSLQRLKVQCLQTYLCNYLRFSVYRHISATIKGLVFTDRSLQLLKV